MSFVLYSQILKQSVLKPASPGITLRDRQTDQWIYGKINTKSYCLPAMYCEYFVEQSYILLKSFYSWTCLDHI